MTDSTAYEHLLIETTDAGVRTITLNRAERLNAVNARLADELPLAMRQAANDDAVRVVVITGASIRTTGWGSGCSRSRRARSR